LSTETTIFIGVGIYIVLMVVVGIYASGRTHTVNEFIVAGRGLPVWLCSTTIVATWFGGGTMMGASGAAYDNGMLGVIADPLGAAIALFLFGFFFARLFRRLRILTVADYMAQRYGQIAAMAITATILFSNIFVYTAVGGLWAVALTDFLQMVILVTGLMENTGEQWLNYLRAWTIVGLVDLSAQTLMQRALAAKSEQAAQNSFYLGGLGYLVFGMIPVTLGIIASVSMPGLPVARDRAHASGRRGDFRGRAAGGHHEFRGQRASRLRKHDRQQCAAAR
jgi:Na+/proline symporter